MDYLPFRDDVTHIKCWRYPTPSEIRFGHGAIHYAEIEVSEWKHKNGKPKKWIKWHFDGRRYYRGA